MCLGANVIEHQLCVLLAVLNAEATAAKKTLQQSEEMSSDYETISELQANLNILVKVRCFVFSIYSCIFNCVRVHIQMTGSLSPIEISIYANFVVFWPFTKWHTKH